MAKKHVFISKVIHNGKEHAQGVLCPDELVEVMQKHGVIAPVQEPKPAAEAPAEKGKK